MQDNCQQALEDNKFYSFFLELVPYPFLLESIFLLSLYSFIIIALFLLYRFARRGSKRRLGLVIVILIVGALLGAWWLWALWQSSNLPFMFFLDILFSFVLGLVITGFVIITLLLLYRFARNTFIVSRMRWKSFSNGILSNSNQKLALVILVVGVSIGVWWQFSGISSTEMKQAETECVDWFKRNALGGYDSFLSDSWKKDGKAVVEVGFDKRGNTYSARLCVYDFDSSKMSSPSPFNSARWEK